MSIPPPSLSGHGGIPDEDVPSVTIIRPVKGLEPHLYECLASTFHQNYPSEKLFFHFCVESTRDPAYHILRQLFHDFPHHNIRIFIESEAPRDLNLGPNPKIRNMSRAYHAAPGDFIWIVDCNAWIGKENCGHMIDKLNGWAPGRDFGVKYKFVHNLPLIVAVDGDTSCNCQTQQDKDGPFFSQYGEVLAVGPEGLQEMSIRDRMKSGLDNGGGRLEELFFASAHGKMYTAINTVCVAPCIVGKSTMFRKSHLDSLTQRLNSSPTTPLNRPIRGNGLDYFSDNICEDHLIGDVLWKHKVPEEIANQGKWKKHNLIRGDLAIQPVSHMAVRAFCNRRVRWLRVRKFTVPAATLVEPNTESILASLHLAFAVTTLLPLAFPRYTEHLRSWCCFWSIWATSMTVWAVTDWALYIMMHSCQAVAADDNTPMFARPRTGRRKECLSRRPFYQWFIAWVGRELLAFPIWAWGVLFGSTVVWRDRKFKVGFDTFVKEIDGGEEGSSQGGGNKGGK